MKHKYRRDTAPPLAGFHGFPKAVKQRYRKDTVEIPHVLVTSVRVCRDGTQGQDQLRSFSLYS